MAVLHIVLWNLAFIDLHLFGKVVGGKGLLKPGIALVLFVCKNTLHEADPPGILDGFAEPEAFLETLPLEDNNAVWNLCCRICVAYEHKVFLDGLHYGAQLMKELEDQ